MKNYVCGKCKREFNSKQTLRKHKDEVCFKKPAVFSKITVIILLVLAVSLLSTHAVHAVTLPSGILHYQILSVDNAQTVATGSNFQQMVNFSYSAYKQYINLTGKYAFQNVEFFNTTTGTVMYSWLENYTSKYAIYWLKLPNGIPASTTLSDIGIGYASNTTDLFNTNTTGEAPQLSVTYGQYDNGANTFNYYFNGSSDSGWTTVGTAGQSTTAPSGSPFGTNALYANDTLGDYMYTSLPSFSSTGNYIIQYYVNVGTLGDFFFTANSTGAGTVTRLDGRGGSTDPVGLAKTASWTSWNGPNTTTTASENTWYLQSTVIAGAGSEVGDYLSTSLGNFGNLGNIVNALNTTYNDTAGKETYSQSGAYIGLIGDQAGGKRDYWNGIVIRAYPPNGVMPTTTFFTPCVDYLGRSAGNECKITQNGTLNASASFSGWIYIASNATVTTHGYYLNATINITNYGTIKGGYLSNGAPAGLNDGTYGGNCTLSYGGSGGGGGGAVSTKGGHGGNTLITGGAGGNTSANGLPGSQNPIPSLTKAQADTYISNYSYLCGAGGGSGAGTATLDGAKGGNGSYGVILISPYIYAGKINTSGQTGAGAVNLATAGGGGGAGGSVMLWFTSGYSHLTLYSSGGAGGAGDGLSTGGSGGSGGNGILILYQNEILNLYLNSAKNANTSIVYPTTSNFTCTANNNDYCAIYVNGNKVAGFGASKNQTFLKSYYGAGIVKVQTSTNISDNANITYYETITKGTPDISLTENNPQGNYTYNGTKMSTYGFISSMNNQLNANLYVNNVKFQSPFQSGSKTYINGTAGTYSFVLNVSGNQNYTSRSLSLTRKISKATPFFAYYLFNEKAGINNVTAYTTEPLSNILTSNAVNNLSLSFYVQYPNGTLSNWKTASIDSIGNFSFGSFIASMNNIGTYKLYISTSGNINYSSETSSNIYAFLSKPYPKLNLSLTSLFSNQNNSFAFASAFNSSNLLYLQVQKVSNTTTLVNSSYKGSPSYQANFSYVYIGNYSVKVIDTYTNLSTIKYYTIVAVSLFQCSSSSSVTVPTGGHIGKVFNLTVLSALNGKRIVNLSSAAGSMQVIGSTQVSTGTALGYTNTTNLKNADFQICLLAGLGSNLNMNGTSSNLFYTNVYNITSSYYFLNTPIDWNSSSGTWIVHNIPLYTVNTTSGVGEFLFAVQNSAGAQLPAWVQIYEYNPNVGQYNLVNYIQTSSQGETPIILQNGQLYSFNVYNQNGALITSLNNQVLACTSVTGCAEIITVNSNLSQYSAPTATCSAQNSTLTCGVASGSSGALAYQLTVVSSGIAGTEEYCSQSLNSPNGQISCSLPSGSYIWQLTYESANGNILPLAGNGNSAVSPSLFSSIGLIIGFFGVLLLVLLASWSPTTAVIILVIATAMFSIMGLFAFTMEDIGGLIILAVLYIWRYRQ